MPVADQGENQNQHRDDEESSGFQRVDVGLGMTFGRTRFKLPLWTGCGHEDIVAPPQRR